MDGVKETSETRKRRVAQAIANERLEGLEVSEDSKRIADNYIVGKASASETAKKIRERYGIQ
ncbi:MAG: antitoxin VbhA family protein [Bifidobacteriaceae bacterium]|nr:antitoxin VbhA family protein [Bifidobacteriaceae bacterium]